ncbi:hypothetical protein WR25_12865, partial [Diploscapter pachys]
DKLSLDRCRDLEPDTLEKELKKSYWMKTDNWFRLKAKNWKDGQMVLMFRIYIISYFILSIKNSSILRRCEIGDKMLETLDKLLCEDHRRSNFARVELNPDI